MAVALSRPELLDAGVPQQALPALDVGKNLLVGVEYTAPLDSQTTPMTY
jgi:hypothetical protein